MATDARKTTTADSSSSIVCILLFVVIFILIEFYSRRPDLLFDKTSSSSVDLHEPGDDSIYNNFVLQSKSNSKQQQQPLQMYL
jgi:hypothetical protein